eukprot:Em0453g2a
MQEVPPPMERTVYSGGEKRYKIKDRIGGKFQIVHFDRLKPCMKTSALNDGTSSSPKSNNSSGLSQQPQVMARPDTHHGGEDMLLSKTEVRTMTHIPLTWVPPQKYLSRRNNTPSLPVFPTPCVAIQPENAAPRIVTVHTRKKGEQCNELVKPITGACAVPWRLPTILEQCLRQVV